MSPQSDKETRQQISERSEHLIQESRQLVEAAQAATRATDSRKHRDTVGNPPPDSVSILSKPPTRTNFLGQCGILLERLVHPNPLRLLVEGELHDSRFVSVGRPRPGGSKKSFPPRWNRSLVKGEPLITAGARSNS
jgi:hypothetical protein